MRVAACWEHVLRANQHQTSLSQPDLLWNRRTGRVPWMIAEKFTVPKSNDLPSVWKNTRFTFLVCPWEHQYRLTSCVILLFCPSYCLRKWHQLTVRTSSSTFHIRKHDGFRLLQQTNWNRNKLKWKIETCFPHLCGGPTTVLATFCVVCFRCKKKKKKKRNPRHKMCLVSNRISIHLSKPVPAPMSSTVL